MGSRRKEKGEDHVLSRGPLRTVTLKLLSTRLSGSSARKRGPPAPTGNPKEDERGSNLKGLRVSGTLGDKTHSAQGKTA